MKTSRPALVLIGVFLASGLSVRAENVPLKMYVAASTKEAVEIVVAQFQAQSGFTVEVSPGPSSKLAKQIVEGGPADLFLSADQANADYLADKRLVAERRNLLGNRLVVVVPSDSRAEIGSLTDLGGDGFQQLALALEKVPAGEYARQALNKAGVWQRVEKKVIGGEDVRATLAFVERGASAGIVYATDPIGTSKVRVALEIAPDLHSPIEYPLVLIKRPSMNPGAAKLYEYMRSEPAKAVFRKAGFEVLP
jgi:molybdate transport system substrate-binding protein